MLRFVTTNEGKLREAREYLDSIDGLEYDYTEVQSDTLEGVATPGAREAARHAGEPVIVDDAGLFVDSLDGFPGPYSAYVEDTLGVERVRELARSEHEPSSASFRCVIAFCDGSATDAGENAEPLPVECFSGVVRGRIVDPRGEGGFGYDPIFEHEGRTFAETSAEEKNAVSHRGRALEAFAEWYEDP